MPLQEIEPNHFVGPESALMMLKPVDDAFRALNKAEIPLRDFDITITGVYTKPRPYGFDFTCRNVEGLLAKMQAVSVRRLPQGPTDFSTAPEPTFNEDRGDSLEGKISAGDTKGRGFRQIGMSHVLHLEIQESGRCNVHIDTHGYVTGVAAYDWGNRAPQHGYWDLLADKVPGMFGSFGEQGQVGLSIRPVKGLDDKIHWSFGLAGEW
jgi:hypothetical protein